MTKRKKSPYYIDLQWLMQKSEAEQRQLLNDNDEDTGGWNMYIRVSPEQAQALRDGAP